MLDVWKGWLLERNVTFLQVSVDECVCSFRSHVITNSVNVRIQMNLIVPFCGVGCVRVIKVPGIHKHVDITQSSSEHRTSIAAFHPLICLRNYKAEYSCDTHTDVYLWCLFVLYHCASDRSTNSAAISGHIAARPTSAGSMAPLQSHHSIVGNAGSGGGGSDPSVIHHSSTMQPTVGAAANVRTSIRNASQQQSQSTGKLDTK